MMEIWSMTDVGLVRRDNQDAFAARQDTASGHTICVVCDGMGGAAGGQMASRIAVTTFMEELEKVLTPGMTPEQLREASSYAVSLANRAIREEASRSEECRNMGTTLVSAVSYAGGFAAGTFVGGQLANLLIKGDLTLQVITSSRDDALLTAIREAGFAISVLDVNGSEFGSEKYLLIAVMKSNRQKDFRKLLQNLDPHAFILANETKYVLGGVVAGRK